MPNTNSPETLDTVNAIDQNEGVIKALAKNSKRPADKTVGDTNADAAEKASDGIDDKETKMPMGLVKVRENVEKIFAGVEGLSEGFADKATTILEAALVELASEIHESIETEYQGRLATAVETYKAELKEHVSGYLTDVAASYFAEHKVDYQNSIKVEIAEQIMENIGASFAAKGIDVSPEKVDLAETLATELAEHEEKFKTLEATLNETADSLAKYQRNEVIAEASTGMTAAGKERFTKLAEQMEFTNSEQFAARLKVIKESVIGEVVESAPVQESTNLIEANEAPVQLQEAAVAAPKFSESQNRLKSLLAR